jgi:hypothetical protein
MDRGIYREFRNLASPVRNPKPEKIRQIQLTARISVLARYFRAASFPPQGSGGLVRTSSRQQPHLINTMKIAKLAIAAAAVSLLAASCCPSTAPAPAPAPVTSSK